MTALIEAGAEVGWLDHDAGLAARRAEVRPGRSGELIEWLAGTQGRFPPEPPRRTRCLLLGEPTPHVGELAERYAIGLRVPELSPDPTKAFAQGIELADREIDEGADLLVLAGCDETSAPTVLISILTGVEPIALLPRGAAAVDTARWIAAAEELRDSRREIAALRSRPDQLLAGTGSPIIAAAAGFALRAAARRTGVVLDGGAVLAAALLCIDTQPLARDWWQLADTSTEAAHTTAAERLELRPLLDFGAGTGDGAAGLLAAEMLRAAIASGVPR